MIEVPLTRGKVALIDDEDEELVCQYKWHYNSGYAVRTSYAGGKRNPVGIKMHRLIANPPAHLVCDHRNGDTLDNRRANIRVCTRKENMANQKMQKRSTTGYKGVTRDVRKGYGKKGYPFRADIKNRDRRYHLGYYRTAEEAARAWDRKAKEVYGPFARLNFPTLEQEELPVEKTG